MDKKKIIRGLLIGCGILVLMGSLFHLNTFRTLEWKSWDWRLKLFSDPSHADENIVLILVDQNSLDIYEQEQGLPWPWPRGLYAAIVKHCAQGEARAVIFDVLFSEGSFFGEEDDQSFASAMAEAGNVFLSIFLSTQEAEPRSALPPYLKKFAFSPKTAPGEAVFPMQSATLDIDVLLSAAAGTGNVQIAPDGDSIFRRIPLLFSLDNFIYPVLSLAVAVFLDPDLKIESIPLDDSGRMIVRYHGPTGTYQAYSAAAVINSLALLEEGKKPQIPPELFKDKIVLVGLSAPGLLDLKASPLSPVQSGTEIHATAIDNLLHRDFVVFPQRIVIFLFLGGLAFLASLGVTLIHRIWQIILFTLMCFALPIVSAWAAFKFGYWHELIIPELTVLSAFIVAALLNYHTEGRQRRFIKRVFHHYLSRHVIDQVIENPSLLKLGGDKREVTSFFLDVAKFTSISEGLSPEDLVNLLNEFLSEMTDIILKSEGTLDKYEGDAIIAFWNAPLDLPDHAVRASRAALACWKKVEELKDHFRERYGHELSIRIGLNSGPAVVGNMGSRVRFDYTAIGDTINLASRLEGTCKQYGLNILMGETTFHEVKDIIAARRVDLIRVVGKVQPVHIYEIVDEWKMLAQDERDSLESYNRGVELYHDRKWDKALDLFQSLEDDKLAQMYVKRILRFKKFPPQDDWTGITELTKK